MRIITQLHCRRLIPLFVFIVCACAITAHADDTHHSLWRVQGKHNNVYLLGSMHILPSTEVLPDVMDHAYANAKHLVMEIDMDDLDPMATATTTMQLGMLPEGKSLQDMLSSADSAQLTKATQEMGIDPIMLSRFRPWLTAITLSQLTLMKKGMNPQDGVEARFTARAGQDHKDIVGLETLEEQLHLFADLSDSEQVAFLMYTLSDLQHTDTDIAVMLDAWRHGDSKALTSTTEKDFAKFPKLFRTLTADRNHRWIAPLEKLLQGEDDSLVIVGALHLVGKEGVVELLKQRGYRVEQQ
jgi:uncharacterized protein